MASAVAIGVGVATAAFLVRSSLPAITSLPPSLPLALICSCLSPQILIGYRDELVSWPSVATAAASTPSADPSTKAALNNG